MQPLQYAIYKGKTGKFGAIQFSLKLPQEKKPEESVPREGCVFVNATNASEADIYDWANKTVIALGINDLGKILLALRTGTEAKIYHDPNMNTDKQGQVSKSINFSSPGGLEKGFMINVSETSGGNVKKCTIPLSPDEVTILGSLIAAAIPLCLAW